MRILTQGSLKEELQRGGSSSLSLHSRAGHGTPVLDHGAWEQTRSSPDPKLRTFLGSALDLCSEQS